MAFNYIGLLPSVTRVNFGRMLYISIIRQGLAYLDTTSIVDLNHQLISERLG
jgi:hypothetical protein